MTTLFDNSLCKVSCQTEVIHTIPNPAPPVSVNMGRSGPNTGVLAENIMGTKKAEADEGPKTPEICQQPPGSRGQTLAEGLLNE